MTQPHLGRSQPALIACAGLGAVAVITTLVIVLTPGPDTSSARSVAIAAVEAYNDGDNTDLVLLSCAEDDQEVEMIDRVPGDEQPRITVTLDNVIGYGGDKGVAFLTVTYTEVPENMRDLIAEGTVRRSRLGLERRGEAWCIGWFGR
jgi:hypothetical protein